MKEYVQEYISGETMEKICKKYKKNRLTVIKELKALHIPIRNRSEAARVRLNENYFETIDTEEKAYWLGFIAADGCINTKALSIALKGQDSTHLQKFLNAIQFKGKIYTYDVKLNDKTFPACSISIQNKKLIDDLGNLGIFPRKSMTYIPVFDKVVENLHPHFWRGMIDGDGHLVSNVVNNSKSIGLTCNEHVALAFREFVFNRLGIELTIRKHVNVKTIEASGKKH